MTTKSKHCKFYGRASANIQNVLSDIILMLKKIIFTVTLQKYQMYLVFVRELEHISFTMDFNHSLNFTILTCIFLYIEKFLVSGTC